MTIETVSFTMNLLKKTSTEIYDIDGHVGYLTDVDTVNHLITTWSENREIDIERVKEISDHIQNNGWVPATLYVADLPKVGLVCYDGNHRLQAYQLSSPNTDSKMVIVDVLKNHRKIYETFNNINQSVPLALIDMNHGADVQNIKEDIENLVKEYEKQYPDFKSTSARCNTPQFNRDNFKDMLYRHVENCDFTVSVSTIREALALLNKAYQTGKHKGAEHAKLREKVVDKCTNGKLWLFAFRRDISNTDIEWAIKECEKTKGDLMKFD